MIKRAPGGKHHNPQILGSRVLALVESILEMFGENSHSHEDIATKIETFAPIHVVQQISTLLMKYYCEIPVLSYVLEITDSVSRSPYSL